MVLLSQMIGCEKAPEISAHRECLRLTPIMNFFFFGLFLTDDRLKICRAHHLKVIKSSKLFSPIGR